MTDFLIKYFVKNYKETGKLSVRTAYGLLASVVGICCNIFLFAIKFAIGMFLHSISVVADSFNNLSDAGSSIISFAGVKMASKPADEEHPFGHGRMEYITALIVAFLIIEVGFTFLKDAIGKIKEPQEMQFQLWTVVVLLLSIGVKLWLSFFNKKIGKTIHSKVMMATATDSMGDAVLTFTTVVSLVVYKVTGVNIDAFVGIGVSLLIMWAGIGIARDTLEPLMGEAVPTEMYQEITSYVEAYDGILGTHDLIVHNYGPGRSMASVHAEVSNSVDIEVSHEIIDKIERDILKDLGLFLVIHMDPIETNNEQLEKIKQQVQDVVHELNVAFSIHDFRMVVGEKQINLIFDLVVPLSCSKEAKKEICQILRKKMHEIDERYQCVIQVENSFVAEEK